MADREAMKANKVPEWYIESCGKIRYMFPKAHAAAYVMMALRVTYFKVSHHPIYYYCATLLSVPRPLISRFTWVPAFDTKRGEWKRSWKTEE